MIQQETRTLKPKGEKMNDVYPTKQSKAQITYLERHTVIMQYQEKIERKMLQRSSLVI
jgi:hypothetical protein